MTTTVPVLQWFCYSDFQPIGVSSYIVGAVCWCRPVDLKYQKTIEAYFLDKTASTTFFLKSKLRSIKKGSMNISDYMQKIKSIGDALQAIGKTESDHNLVMTVLLGLPEEYRSFVSALNTHRHKPMSELK
uniref:Retrovirus-related Pol polyprotein from transposon TNT 1-94 n=1 Tax=Ananas comosus var. bracteatus TaxID=296719 RepID=A0A6V7PS85_ANACO|nr:unnamed protein product [Ananas comosus var. bracteatus]